MRHDPPLAHDGDTVRHPDDLPQLVGDENDGGAVLFELVDDAEELVRLLRRQHRRRLVEDEHPRAQIERLDDLDLLALPHAEVPDRRVGGDLLHAEAREQPADLLLGRPVIDEVRPGGRVAEDDVLGDAHMVDLHEVLVHHADPVLKRARDVVGTGFPVDQDLARVRRVLSVKDPHQRRLARAVFPDEGVRLAGLQRKVDPVVRHERPKAFCNGFHPYDRSHPITSFGATAWLFSGKI